MKNKKKKAAGRDGSWRVMKNFRVLRAARDAFFFAPTYEPGSGLRSHVDIPQLGPYVLDGSFGSDTEMVFEPRPLPGSNLFKKRQKVFLQRCSLLLIFREARDKWKHQIPARDYDTVERRRIPRDSRVSLIFRHTGTGTDPPATYPQPPDPRQRESN